MPTTNPVPSLDPSDLLFNAGKLDEVVNGAGNTYTDRLGVTRRTLGGIDAEAEALIDAIDAEAVAQRDNIQGAADLVLAAAGYATPVEYAAGISMTLQTQTVSYNGDTYAPKQTELPFTTSGTFETAKFRLIQGVASADLAAPSGSLLIGHIPAGAGAAPTDVQRKLRETVSILDFYANGVSGAKVDPTGVIDSTAGIQAAINAAAGVAKVVFPAGTYRVTASRNTMPFPWEGGIKIPSNSYLSLDPEAVIQVAPNSLDKYFCFSLYAVQNVIIEGGQIIGDRTTHTYPNLFNTLADLNSNNYRTKDNYDSDPPVWADGKVAYVYLDTSANNGTYTRTAGAWVRTSASVPSYITHEFGYGIGVLNSQNVWINRVSVSNFTGDCINITDSNQGPLPAPATRTQRVFVTNCRLSASRRQGISVVDGDDVFINGNHFQDIGVRLNLQDGMAPRSGIDIESGTGSKSDRVTVSNNVFLNCVSTSVNNYDGNSVTIVGNTMDTPISYGSSVNTTISGNVIYKGGIVGNNARAPIAFTYTQSGSTMTVTLASTHDLVTGEEAYFEFLDANNFVAHFGLFTVTKVSSTVLTFDTPGFTSASGNGRYKYSVNNITITGNIVYGGNLNATGNKVLIANNSIVNGEMFIFSSCRNANIVNNAFQQSRIYGAAGYENVVISGNTFKDTVSNYAINIQGVNSLVANNHIINCWGGIFANAGSGRISGNFIDISGHPVPQSGIATSTASALYEVSENTIRNHTGSYAINVASPTRLVNNRILRWTGGAGIIVSGANSDGSIAIGNIVECNRSSNGTTNYGIVVASNTKFRAIGNTIYSINAAMVRAIDTSTSTNSRITNNVYEGAINSNASDTLTGNVPY